MTEASAKPFILTGKTMMKCSKQQNPFYRARIRAGLKPSEAADKIGITYQSLNDYENGKSIPSYCKTWRRIAEVYGCTISDLVGSEVLDSDRRLATYKRNRRKGERKVG